jgi:hypothetical protein
MVVPCRCTLRPFERIERRLALMRAELLANFCARAAARGTDVIERTTPLASRRSRRCKSPSW